MLPARLMSGWVIINHKPLALGGQAPSHQAPSVVSRPCHMGEGKQQLRAMPCGLGRAELNQALPVTPPGALVLGGLW